jgi:hypothetical protein
MMHCQKNIKLLHMCYIYSHVRLGHAARRVNLRIVYYNLQENLYFLLILPSSRAMLVSSSRM